MSQSVNLLEDPTSLLSDCLKDGLPGLDAALKKLSLEVPEKYQEAIFQCSFYAIAEFLQLIGIGAGFTSLNMQGFKMDKIIRKIDEVKKQIETILGAPAIEALEYLQRGIIKVQTRDNMKAIDEFKEVVKKSIKGRIYEKENLETVANLTRYLIFADIMISTYDPKKDCFVPYELLESEQKLGIKFQITLHLQKLLNTQEQQKSSLDAQWFSRPSTKSEKKKVSQNLVDSILKSSLQYICPPGAPVPTKFVPDGEEDGVWLNLDGKPGQFDATTVYIYKNVSTVIIRHYSYNKKYLANINCGQAEELVVTADHCGLTINNSTKEVISSNLDSADLDFITVKGYFSLIKTLIKSGVNVNDW